MSADFWAGYVSGAAGILIGNPLDLVKTRLQAGNAGTNAIAAGTATTPLALATPRSFREHFDRAGTLVKGRSYSALQVENSTDSNVLAQAQPRLSSAMAR